MMPQYAYCQQQSYQMMPPQQQQQQYQSNIFYSQHSMAANVVSQHQVQYIPVSYQPTYIIQLADMNPIKDHNKELLIQM